MKKRVIKKRKIKIILTNTVKFKEMFCNASVYPSAHSIYKSARLDWNWI